MSLGSQGLETIPNLCLCSAWQMIGNYCPPRPISLPFVKQDAVFLFRERNPLQHWVQGIIPSFSTLLRCSAMNLISNLRPSKILLLQLYELRVLFLRPEAF
jgi:hypothetical protein